MRPQGVTAQTGTYTCPKPTHTARKEAMRKRLKEKAEAAAEAKKTEAKTS